MTSLRKISIMLLIAVGSSVIVPNPSFADESATYDQVLNCLRIANNRFRGRIREVSIEKRGGRRVCELELISANGRKFKTYVDINTGRIVRQNDRDDDDD
jgi:hypothetical protein